MSAYSTITIIKADAKRRIMEAISEMSNEKLGDMMDVVGRDSLYNYLVVDYIEKENKDCPCCGHPHCDLGHE